MKLVYNHLAPVFLFLLQWMDCSCSCLLPTYLNLFHVLIYKVCTFFLFFSSRQCFHISVFCSKISEFSQVYTDGRPRISRHGRKATISDFYGLLLYIHIYIYIFVVILLGYLEKLITIHLILNETAIILPSLQRLHYDLVDSDDITGKDNLSLKTSSKNKNNNILERGNSFAHFDLDREDECGICLEPCTKMVLPSCCHAMCINCYRDW